MEREEQQITLEIFEKAIGNQIALYLSKITYSMYT